MTMKIIDQSKVFTLQTVSVGQGGWMEHNYRIDEAIRKNPDLAGMHRWTSKEEDKFLYIRTYFTPNNNIIFEFKEE